MRRTALAATLVFSLVAACANADDGAIRRLAAAVKAGEAGPDGGLSVAAIDAGPAAVPLLRDLLRHKDKEVRSRAMTALAYIGGDAAPVTAPGRTSWMDTDSLRLTRR